MSTVKGEASTLRIDIAAEQPPTIRLQRRHQTLGFESYRVDFVGGRPPP